MIVYISMIILAVSFSAMANIKENKTKLIKNGKLNLNILCWYISEIVLIIVSGFRYDVGMDYMATYVPFFNGILIDSTFNSNIEFGFFLLNKLVQIFTKDYVGIFVISSVIFFHYMYKGIRENSEDPTLSVYLLITSTYFFYFLNAMRQMLAISMFFYAIKFIKERKFKKYLFYILLAATFHTSILIVLPLYFLYGLKNNVKIMFFITIIAIMLKKIIVKAVLELLTLIKYGGYVGSVFDNNKVGVVMILINLVILILYIIYFYKDIKIKHINFKENEDINFYLILHLLSLIFLMYDGYIPLIRRVFMITNITLILFIPSILKKEKNIKYRKGITSFIVICYFTYFIITIGINNSNSVLPYQSIINRR